MERMTLQYDVAGGRRNKLCDSEWHVERPRPEMGISVERI